MEFVVVCGVERCGVEKKKMVDCSRSFFWVGARDEVQRTFFSVCDFTLVIVYMGKEIWVSA